MDVLFPIADSLAVTAWGEHMTELGGTASFSRR
jgi:hypothetical protein